MKWWHNYKYYSGSEFSFGRSISLLSDGCCWPLVPRLCIQAVTDDQMGIWELDAVGLLSDYVNGDCLHMWRSPEEHNTSA